MSADDAQLNIGNALYNAGKYREAVAEYQRVISDYPKTDSVPAAYYKLGLSYNAAETDRSRAQGVRDRHAELPSGPTRQRWRSRRWTIGN